MLKNKSAVNAERSIGRMRQQGESASGLKGSDEVSEVAIDCNWNDRRNGSAHVLDMVEVGSGRAIAFELLKTQIYHGGTSIKEAVME
jgi:hypothetical protein